MSYAWNPTASELVILEENHYYPYGLKHTNYNTDAWEFIKNEGPGYYNGTPLTLGRTYRPDYQYKYNGKEWQDELGLNMYAMDMRQYDPAIGRWVVQDPVIHHGQSPYNGYDGNPIFWADPSGADAGGGQKVQDEMGRDKFDRFGMYIAPMDRGEGNYDHTEPVQKGYLDTDAGGTLTGDDARNWAASMQKSIDSGQNVIDIVNKNQQNQKTVEQLLIEKLSNMKIGSSIKGKELDFLDKNASYGIKSVTRESDTKFNIKPTTMGGWNGIKENSYLTIEPNKSISGTYFGKKKTITGYRITQYNLPAMEIGNHKTNTYVISGNYAYYFQTKTIISSWKIND